MLKTKRLFANAFILAAATQFMSASARADVLEQLPADSLVAVKVANLTQTSKKLAQLARDFGVAGFILLITVSSALLGIIKVARMDPDTVFRG